MTRATITVCLQIFDRLRLRVGAESAMEQAIEFATAARRDRKAILRAAEIDPIAVAIIDGVAKWHGLDVETLRSSIPRAIDVRNEAVYLARRRCTVSRSVLARYLKVHPSTLLYGERKFAARLAADQLLAQRMARVLAPREQGRAA